MHQSLGLGSQLTIVSCLHRRNVTSWSWRAARQRRVHVSSEVQLESRSILRRVSEPGAREAELARALTDKWGGRKERELLRDAKEFERRCKRNMGKIWAIRGSRGGMLEYFKLRRRFMGFF